MRPSDSCLSIGPSSLCSQRAYRRLPAMLSLPVRLAGDRRARVLVDRLTREAESTAGTDRPPRFLGNPKVTAPTSKDPGGTFLPGQYGRAGAAPACAHGGGSREETNFGAGWAGSDTRCLRFARAVTCKDARLASGCWPDSSGWAPRPTGFLERFLRCSYIAFPLSQASPGASALRCDRPN